MSRGSWLLDPCACQGMGDFMIGIGGIIRDVTMFGCREFIKCQLDNKVRLACYESFWLGVILIVSMIS